MFSLFIFRRDLRLEDNIGLMAALKNSEKVLPCFIFDPRQCQQNDYKGLPAIQFMMECLEDLQQQLQKKNGKLSYFYGTSEDVLDELLQRNPIEAIYFNRDYTPFSLARDKNIESLCVKHQVQCESFDDALLNAPTQGLKSDGTPYQIFSAYYRHAMMMPIAAPQKNIAKNYYIGPVSIADKFVRPFPNFLKPQLSLKLKGGRQACLDRVDALAEMNNYAVARDFPAKNGTSQLSAYLKFTTCSVREIYHAIQQQLAQPEGLLRELYWRDFFTMIAFYHPHVFGHAFHRKYDRIRWVNREDFFAAWCQGQTGFPIVDAGMRELNETGIMHNRVRMITASFLIKDCHIDWRWGEKYFAQHLIDYDPAINNGNWQWVAGTGTDAQPYFRIFNPWLQQKKFDPDCVYIKKWIPELSKLDARVIHNLFKEKNHSVASYPVPILDHAIEAARAKTLYSA